MFETLTQDLRYGLRMVARNPGFSAVVILSLALGMGANAAIFSILDPLLLRQLPVQRPEELVWINSAGSLGAIEISEVEAFHTYRDKNQVFSGVFAFAPATDYQVIRKGQTNLAKGEIVSGNYFTVLGVHPLKGRLLNIDDESTGGPVVVLGFDYWKRVLASDPTIVGKVLPLNKLLYTIVGVAPPEFFGVEVGKSPDFFLPLSGGGPTRAEWVQILARLKPGVSLAQAQAGLEPLFRKMARNSSVPEVEQREFMDRLILTSASRGLSDLRTQFSLAVRILMAVAGLVLLVACMNVANLLLAQGIARRREFCVKQALGAGRWRLVRQLLTESALLAVMGGALGLVLGSWTSSALLAWMSTARHSVVLTAGINGRVLLFTAAVLALTVLLSGLVPAISTTHPNLADDLKVHTPGRAGAARSRLGSLLVVVQVALSVILLVGAGLLLHSLVNLETFDVGFDRDHVLAVSISRQASGRSPEQMKHFYAQVLAQIRNLPGVRSASYSGFTPISGSEMGVNITVEGYAMRPRETANERFVGISPGYFQTLGIPLLRGRDFTAQDVQDPPRVAIINRTMAHRFFGQSDPLGKRFKQVEGNRPALEIIGIAADSKYNDLREDSVEFFYVPSSRGTTFEVRTNGNTQALTAPLRQLIVAQDSSVTITAIKTLREQVGESLHQDRLIAALCSTFGALALMLTCVGLYGTLSFSVRRRTNEIGIRMALGACPSDIFALIIRQGILLTLTGLILGIAGALASGSLLKSMLFGVKQSDVTTLCGVTLLLFIAAVFACYLPARQAASVEPMQALRTE